MGTSTPERSCANEEVFPIVVNAERAQVSQALSTTWVVESTDTGIAPHDRYCWATLIASAGSHMVLKSLGQSNQILASL